MSREKQIEEMAEDMCSCCKEALAQECEYSICECVRKHAEALYNAGYRKQSEVIDEFAREMKDYLDDTYSTGEDVLIEVHNLIDYIVQKMKGGAE